MKYDVIIITGQLAALKSTIANKLSMDLSAFLLCKDSIKEQLSSGNDQTNREQNKKLSVKTVELMQFMMESLLSFLSPIILEANFKADEYESLVRSLDERGLNHLTIYCYGDFEILYTRYLKRLDSLHAVHKSMGIISKKDFEKSMNYYHEIYSQKEVVKLDTSLFNDASYNHLRGLIKHDEFKKI